MRTIYLKKEIKDLELDDKAIKILNENSIFFIEDLWPLGRKDLKELGLVNKQINDIIIKMQLNGFDLNKRMY